ncbi:MAG TPA: ABC transporter substrate-binding protein [Stellaceae bacterium]|nr:ABC transporter substrate-binding protein [Stellaceae bacterium]
MRAKVLCGWAAVASLLFFTAPASSADIPTIRIGWTVPAEEAKWLIMKRPELFKNVNKTYKVEFFQYQGTAPIAQALVAKAADCGTQSPISFAQAVGEGDFQGYILGSLAQEKAGYFSVFWGALDSSPIHNAQDLKGKTIASTAFNSGIYFYLLEWLKKAGLDPAKDVKLVEIPFPQVEDQLRAGRIAAGPFAQPFASRAFEKGGIHKVFEMSELLSPLTDTFEACGKDFTDKNTQAVKDYMEDFKQATIYAIAHPEDAKKVTSEVTKIDYATLDKYLMTKQDFYRDPVGTPDFHSIQITLDLFTKAGYIKKPLKATDYERLDLSPSAN